MVSKVMFEREWYDMVQEYSDEQRLKLYDALFALAFDGKETKLEEKEVRHFYNAYKTVYDRRAKRRLEDKIYKARYKEKKKREWEDLKRAASANYAKSC